MRSIAADVIKWNLVADGVPEDTAELFIKYHKSNPQIWREFEAHALELIQNGVKHYGAKAIMEIIRFHRAIRKQSEWKISNSYTAYYARVFALKYDEYAEFFSFKEVRGIKEAA